MLNLNFNPFPLLFSERLLLRHMTETDAPALFRFRSDEEVMRYIERPLAVKEEDTLVLIRKIEEGLQNNDSITWAISLKHDPALIGTIGFWRIDKENYRAEIGYLLDPRQQGKGLMQEAIKTVLDYGFGVLGLNSVEGDVNPDNAASIRLLEKNGFVKEAHFRQYHYFNGRFSDTAVYSLLASQI